MRAGALSSGAPSPVALQCSKILDMPLVSGESVFSYLADPTFQVWAEEWVCFCLCMSVFACQCVMCVYVCVPGC